jgi:hypothetical protein
MSMAALIRKALGKEIVVVDSKSMADYAARIARGEGKNLRQRKLEMGGWVLKAARKPRRQSDLF